MTIVSQCISGHHESASGERGTMASNSKYGGKCVKCGGRLEHVMVGSIDFYRCLKCYAADMHDARSCRSHRTETGLPPQDPAAEEAARQYRQAQNRKKLAGSRAEKSWIAEQASKPWVRGRRERLAASASAAASAAVAEMEPEPLEESLARTSSITDSLLSQAKYDTHDERD